MLMAFLELRGNIPGLFIYGTRTYSMYRRVHKQGKGNGVLGGMKVEQAGLNQSHSSFMEMKFIYESRWETHDCMLRLVR